ncbi:hypothetical protein SETIT_4G204000v2 [Setaria italica]|uniref:Cytochrome P450 n=1 Tax=Setaria italica TaxID=4555 RepID=A0A368QWM4_SETIT|nr:hypothetical protein SETIT_4G204000v2 [Setaria italica]
MYYLYVGLALVSLLIVLTKRQRCAAPARRHGLRLPPAPWQLPLIGSLHHIAGQLPHRAMRDLARRHGPVMLLRIGEVPMVVVSSREGAREVMKAHDLAFASRPLSAALRVLVDGGRDIIFAPYGEHWRQLRKICAVELLSARRVLSFRAVREDEVAAALRSCAADAAAAADARSAVVDMHARLSALVADATVRAVVGDRFERRDVFLRALDRAVELAAGFNPADLWPSSRLVGRLSGVIRRAEECHDAVFGIIDGIVEEHQERMVVGGGVGKDEDVVDVLLRLQKDAGLQFPLDLDIIKAVIFDMVSAGSETSATTLEWAMAEFVRNPKAMARATAEVRGAFAAHGAVPEHALGELRYLHLVIRETLRLHPPAPLLLPRECREPCRVLGYDVPRGTTVIVNVWALGHDERYWPDDPEEFRPERFEAEAGGVVQGRRLRAPAVRRRTEDVPRDGVRARQRRARARQPAVPLRLGGARRGRPGRARHGRGVRHHRAKEGRPPPPPHPPRARARCLVAVPAAPTDCSSLRSCSG